ncbi:unnamed protein product [Rotaria magnacalcarata]|uniref:G-protein coupled receptors family 1 profile domain-containing protein n=1 Tax=Rotaria magnacalcarata TaxID=392030 RepID=A0A819F7I5_9BILA|nr:unnamed protein product [Rotaria magnacalcarata]CAF3863119.1 unnamed protein product [Rotaria magnacalcarata]
MGNVPDFCRNLTETINETSYQHLSECWTEMQIAEFLRIYLPLIILPISLISNCLSFFALRSRHMRGTATAFFMLILSVLDPLVLLTKNLVYYPTFLAADAILCKILYFLIYVVGYTTVWILVIMTADKFFAVWFPLKVAYFCTITRAKYVCVLLIAMTSIISLHHFWTIASVKHPKDATQHACYYDMSRYALIQRIWRYADFMIWCFLPFILISTLSLLIIYKLSQKRKVQRQNHIKTQQTNVDPNSISKPKRSSALEINNSEIEMRSNQKQKIVRSRNRHITFMLLAVAGVFLLFTLPNSIYFVLESTYGFNKAPTTNDYYLWRRYRRLTILTIFMFQLSDLQHAANFFIYLLTSGKFRRTVLHICLSMLYIVPTILSRTKQHTTNSKRYSSRRFDRDQHETLSRPNTFEATNFIRHSRDTSNNKPPQKNYLYSYHSSASRSTTGELSQYDNKHAPI